MTHRLAIHDLLDGRATPDRVHAFLEGKSFPLVEGPRVTVVWRGEADGVNLRHWIYGLESSNALSRIPGTDLWYIVVEIPGDTSSSLVDTVTRTAQLRFRTVACTNQSPGPCATATPQLPSSDPSVVYDTAGISDPKSRFTKRCIR